MTTQSGTVVASDDPFRVWPQAVLRNQTWRFSAAVRRRKHESQCHLVPSAGFQVSSGIDGPSLSGGELQALRSGRERELTTYPAAASGYYFRSGLVVEGRDEAGRHGQRFVENLLYLADMLGHGYVQARGGPPN